MRMTTPLLMLFCAVPLAVVWFAWTMGREPPASLFWAEEDVTVIATAVRWHGPGRRGPYLEITALTDAEEEGRFRADLVARGGDGRPVLDGDGMPVPTVDITDRIAVRVGPGGAMAWREPSGTGMAIALTVVSLMVLTGGIHIWLRARRRRSLDAGQGD